MTGGGRGSSGDNCRCYGCSFSRVCRTADRSDPGKRTARAHTQWMRISDFAYLEVWGELE